MRPQAPASQPEQAAGGQLDTICQWLDLPRLAVIDVTRLHGCRLPDRPVADGLLLDRVSSEAGFYRVQTLLESLWGIPVLGGMEEAERPRGAIAALAPGERPPRWLGEALGNSLSRMRDVDRIRAAGQCPSIFLPPAAWTEYYCRAELVDATRGHRLGRCFPLLLSGDARMAGIARGPLCDFSPLGDERLPEGTDIVYLGCGHPQRFAQALSENQCLAAALRQHVCNGLRFYAEGGGLAYLCEQIELGDGRRFAMTGVLPAIARENPQPRAPTPMPSNCGTRIGWVRPARDCVVT